MFKVGDVVVRTAGDQDHTLEYCEIGNILTITEVRGRAYFDAGDEYPYYFDNSDFELAGEENLKVEGEALRVMRSRLRDLKAEEINKDLIPRIRETLNDFIQLKAEMQKEIPLLVAFLREVEEAAETRSGEFSLVQFRALAAKARITKLGGTLIRANGTTEDLTLNSRKAIHPPMNTLREGDTLNIDFIDVDLKAAPDVSFSSSQILALLRSGF